MNPIRLLIAFIVAFVAITGTDYLIHEVWLKEIYTADAGKLWRKAPDMVSIHVGHVMIAIAFTMLWARIALGGAAYHCAIGLGFFMGLAHAGGNVITYAVQPLPAGLLTKWIIADMLQGILVALLLYAAYKPSKACPDVRGK